MSDNKVMPTAEALAGLAVMLGDTAELLENEPAMLIAPADIDRACEYLLSVGYEFLADITAVDYPDKGVFRLLYQVSNYQNGDIITLKTEIERETAQIQSVEKVWRAADWLEREVYDMFGIKFIGHPNMKRILMWEGFDGWPLRKDFVHRQTEYQGRRRVD